MTRWRNKGRPILIASLCIILPFTISASLFANKSLSLSFTNVDAYYSLLISPQGLRKRAWKLEKKGIDIEAREIVVDLQIDDRSNALYRLQSFQIVQTVDISHHTRGKLLGFYKQQPFQIVQRATITDCTSSKYFRVYKQQALQIVQIARF